MRVSKTNDETTRNEDWIELVRELLQYINDTPALLSLLYDMDFMPEQLEQKSKNWFRMLMLAEAWKKNMPADENRC